MAQIRLTLCLTCALAIAASAECREPHFSKGRNFIDSGHGSLYISVRPSDFTVGNVICLVQTLRSRHQDWKDVGVLVFTSSNAARHFQASHADYEDRAAWTRAAKKLHASYFFNADKHEEYLEIMPLGYEGAPSYSSRIDFPVATSVVCHLEINDRCLTMLENVEYPRSALDAGQSGTITLSGVIAPDGHVKSIHVVDGSSRADRQEELASAALQNFRSWHFDPSNRKDPVRITYSYQISSSTGSGGQMGIQFELPNRIVILGGR